MTIAYHHRVLAVTENAVSRATSTPPNVAAQRICHLYGSLGSKKIVAPSRPPSTAPIIITVGKFITLASAIMASDNSQNTRSHAIYLEQEQLRLPRASVN